jgi:hypothetical protein
MRWLEKFSSIIFKILLKIYNIEYKFLIFIQKSKILTFYTIVEINIF